VARGRTVAIISGASVLTLAAAGGAAYYILRTTGSPAETAQRFAAAWQKGDASAMSAELAVLQPLTPYEQLRTGLAVESTSVDLGTPAPERDGRSSVPYTATLRLKNVGEWTYKGQIDVEVVERTWRVAWTPKTLHPEMTAGAAFSLKTNWPERAAVTDASGARLDSGDVGGSIQQLVGFLDKATKKDVDKLGPSYAVGQAVGRGGLQETFQTRLAGTPSTEIKLGDKTLHTVEGSKGEGLETTLDPGIQSAAVAAVKDLDKPAALVALDSGSGEIKAVVNNRGGFDRAINGQYAPGSTFKAVTAIGLLADGVSPTTRVTCPKYATVGGQSIRNSERAEFGSLSFTDSFAHSCNTTFAPLTKERLNAAKLRETAELVGFNEPLSIGVPATKPSFPMPESDAELAMASFGQGRITASPLSMAAVGGAIADGTWRPPTLVPGLDQKAKPRELPAQAREHLDGMMAAVVTRGTAKSAQLPKGTRGKTGTAEFGTGPKLDLHAWFMGHKGKLAFAVIVEGGGGGGKVAAPVAARFLRAL
jgi:cell division protein FtsI/penicillin-binding protein 2